jgi:transposase-like protein
MKCPNCQVTKHQVKNGLNPSGSQKYRCNKCRAVYTPEPKLNGYRAETRLLAIRMRFEGNSYNAIGRILKVNPQSVINWVKAHTADLPAAPVPEKPKTAELGELDNFPGEEKRSLPPNHGG